IELSGQLIGAPTPVGRVVHTEVVTRRPVRSKGGQGQRGGFLGVEQTTRVQPLGEQTLADDPAEGVVSDPRQETCRHPQTCGRNSRVGRSSSRDRKSTRLNSSHVSTSYA